MEQGSQRLRRWVWDSVRSRSRLWWPTLFFALSLASSLLVALYLPPFQGPDELVHVYRADLVAHGVLISRSLPSGDGPVAGGPAHVALAQAEAPFDKLPFHPETKVGDADLAAARQVRWSASTDDLPFPNTAIYPPPFYLPSALGLIAGERFNIGVIDTLFLSRALNALACSAAAALAMGMAGRSGIWLWMILLLPMSTFLFATVTQDGLMVAFTALGCALVSRGTSEGRPLRPSQLLAACACFTLVGMAKLPYALFGLILFAAPSTASRTARIVAGGLPIAAGAVWSLSMKAFLGYPLSFWPANVDPAGQLARLIAHPGWGLLVAATTIRDLGLGYARQFVGVLGWLDTELPPYFYWAAGLALLAALGLSLGGGRTPAWRRLPVAACVAVLASGAAIFVILYLQWTPLGHPRVEGVQGRYFLPLALCLSLAWEGPRPLWGEKADGTIQLGARVLTALFALVSLVVTVSAIATRY